MNPVTVQILNEAEHRRRSEQVEALQLLNQSEAVRSSRSSLLQALMDRLGTILQGARPQLHGRRVRSGRQLPQAGDRR